MKKNLALLILIMGIDSCSIIKFKELTYYKKYDSFGSNKIKTNGFYIRNYSIRTNDGDISCNRQFVFYQNGDMIEFGCNNSNKDDFKDFLKNIGNDIKDFPSWGAYKIDVDTIKIQYLYVSSFGMIPPHSISGFTDLKGIILNDSTFKMGEHTYKFVPCLCKPDSTNNWIKKYEKNGKLPKRKWIIGGN